MIQSSRVGSHHYRCRWCTCWIARFLLHCSGCRSRQCSREAECVELAVEGILGNTHPQGCTAGWGHTIQRDRWPNHTVHGLHL